MKQRTISYGRNLTITHPDDCTMDNEELVGAVDNLSQCELEDLGISLIDDETTGFTSCTTDIPEA
jgi:hypothetical protein